MIQGLGVYSEVRYVLYIAKGHCSLTMILDVNYSVDKLSVP